jgi:hypothetical protein
VRLWPWYEKCYKEKEIRRDKVDDWVKSGGAAESDLKSAASGEKLWMFLLNSRDFMIPILRVWWITRNNMG